MPSKNDELSFICFQTYWISYMHRVTIYSQNLTKILDSHLFITEKELVYIFLSMAQKISITFFQLLCNNLKNL